MNPSGSSLQQQQRQRRAGGTRCRGWVAAAPTRGSFVAAAGTLGMLVLLAFASNAMGQSYLPADAEEAMVNAMFLNDFLDAADAVGLADTLADSNFTGTIFAPVDLAFDALMKASNVTWDALVADNATLSTLVKLHIVPGTRYFPLTTLKDGLKLDTLAGAPLYVRRDVPGIVHVYGVERPELDPLNFATVLQYQEIKGGKAILYVVDKVLTPGKPAPPPAAPTRTRRKMMQ